MLENVRKCEADNDCVGFWLKTLTLILTFDGDVLWNVH